MSAAAAPARVGLLMRLGGFLLPLALVLSALWPSHPLFAPGPVLALPLYLVAAAVWLDLPKAARLGRVLAAQLRAGIWLAFGFTLLLGAALYLPVVRLRAGGDLSTVLGIGVLVGLAWVFAWHHAITPALLLEEDDAALASRRRALGEEATLGASAWLAATSLLLLMLLSLACALTPLWPASLHAPVLLLHAAVLAPLLAIAVLAASRRQLDQARQRIADALAAHAVATPGRRAAVVDLDAALYAAARAGQVDEALALLDAGANAHALPAPGGRDQRSLAMLAAVQPDLRLLRALIAAGVDVNRARAGLTPLLAAVRDSYHGRPDAVLMLLANGADPRASDGNGQTALHAAARSADPAIAALLLDAGALLDLPDAQGATPLGIAAGLGNLDLMRFLLDRRAQCELAGAEPALLLAAAGGSDDAQAVGLLLRRKARVDAHGRLGRTALHAACLQGNAHIVDALLAARANPDLPDEQGVTPLLEAARAGAVECVRRLAAHGVDATARDQSGRNALAIACQSAACNSATVEALLELGADPRQPANDGRRAIDHAVAAGRWAHVALLDPGYVLPACLSEDEEGVQDTPPLMRLRLALERGSLAAARELVQQVAATPDECATLLLELAPRLQRGGACVLAATLDPEAVDGEGTLLLRQLLALGPTANPAQRALLERGAQPCGRGSLARYLDAALLHTGAGPDAERLAIALLERGADVFAADHGAPPLHQALRLRWHDLVRALLARGVDPESRDAAGTSALMLACQLDDEAMVRGLLLQGAQPAARAVDGQTAQGLALALGRANLTRWLGWSSWRLPRRPLRDADVSAAARQGDVEAVERLLDLGLGLDGVDAQGCTALLRACGGGHVELARKLLERGADVSRAAHSGATCLSVALTADRIEIVRLLAGHGVDPGQRLPGGITPLMIAAALGQQDAIGILLAQGADAQARDDHGGAALHALAQFGFGATLATAAVAAWEALLAAGAEADVVNAVEETPLLLLLGASFEPGTPCHEDVILAQLEVLLRRGVDLGQRERRGFGALHLAALHGLGRVVRRLLAAGADPGLRDAINRRPAEIALMRGFVDIAAEFAPSQPAPSIARFLREPRV